MSSHPDPEIARIATRNARAFSEAVQAPPPEVADDPQAYLAWVRQREVVPAQRPRPLNPTTGPRKKPPASLPRQKEPRPPIRTGMEANAERNRQLAALAAQIKQEGGQIPDTSEPHTPSGEVPSANVTPQID